MTTTSAMATTPAMTTTPTMAAPVALPVTGGETSSSPLRLNLLLAIAGLALIVGGVVVKQTIKSKG